MARLIDADALDRKIVEMTSEPAYQHTGEDWLNGLCMAMEAVNEAPTVDAVKVVRCRDCKRCFKHTTKRNRQKMWICMRNEVDVCVIPDDFCSYGERKDGDGNGS